MNRVGHARPRASGAGPGRASVAALAAALLSLATPAIGPARAAAAPVAVALTPLAVPPEVALLGVPAEPLARALDAELARLGHRVSGGDEVGPVWAAVLDSVGGLYDSSTGELDDAKEAAARRSLAARAAARFGAGAVLRPSVEIAEAEWRGGKAEWDGAEEGIGSVPGGGVVPALTLVVEVLGADGAVRCRGRGGIQVLVKYGFGGGPKDVKRDKLLADPKRVARAVSLALECFTGREGAAP